MMGKEIIIQKKIQAKRKCICYRQKGYYLQRKKVTFFLPVRQKESEIIRLPTPDECA
jgi:hypothetical protein